MTAPKAPDVPFKLEGAVALKLEPGGTYAVELDHPVSLQEALRIRQHFDDIGGTVVLLGEGVRLVRDGTS